MVSQSTPFITHALHSKEITPDQNDAYLEALRPTVCPFCSATLASLARLSKHLALLHANAKDDPLAPAPGLDWECAVEDCAYTSPSRTAFFAHCHDVHIKRQACTCPIQSCMIGGRVFATSGDLALHLAQTHHLNDSLKRLDKSVRKLRRVENRRANVPYIPEFAQIEVPSYLLAPFHPRPSRHSGTASSQPTQNNGIPSEFAFISRDSMSISMPTATPLASPARQRHPTSSATSTATRHISQLNFLNRSHNRAPPSPPPPPGPSASAQAGHPLARQVGHLITSAQPESQPETSAVSSRVPKEDTSVLVSGITATKYSNQAPQNSHQVAILAANPPTPHHFDSIRQGLLDFWTRRAVEAEILPPP